MEKATAEFLEALLQGAAADDDSKCADSEASPITHNSSLLYCLYKSSEVF